MELLKYPSLVFSLIDDKNESSVVGNGNECFDSEMTLLLRWGQKEFGLRVLGHLPVPGTTPTKGP